MVKFEGESGIDLQFVLDQLQKGTTLSVQKIKKSVCASVLPRIGF